MIYPRPLKEGDKIALIAPASPPPAERLDLSIKAMENLGFEVVLGESCTSYHGYLAGNDDLRANDINMMFEDKTIKGIFAIRGGYGCVRLLDKIKFSIIKNNPKVFGGYSDITALHSVINEKCKLITFHCPMASTEFYKDIDEYTIKSFKNFIFGTKNEFLNNPIETKIQTLKSGKARGQLIGGNLSVISSTIGSKYQMNLDNKIIFIEEISEPPYKIDKMLLQMVNANMFKNCKGIILGYFTDCKASVESKSLTLNQVFDEILLPLNIPIVSNVCCGHDLPTMTLPLGASISLDATNGTITFI